MAQGTITVRDPRDPKGTVKVCRSHSSDYPRLREGSLVNFYTCYQNAAVGDLVTFRIVRDTNNPNGYIAINLAKTSSIPCL